MIFDYETLKLIWWLFVGVLLIGFALTDGFDMGAGTLLPFLGRDDTERRVIINTVGPHWDGNQVWFILAGGALFAAWPPVYAAAFSGLYVALLLVLFALFFRPVGFDYRSKLDDPRWRGTWDWLLFVGSAVPALVFGVAFGNLLLGLPFQLDADLRSSYQGGFFGLLHPFALLTGLVSIAMLVMHGAAYLQLRTAGDLAERAGRAGRAAAGVMMAGFVVAGLWLALGIEGLRITAMPDPDTAFNPLQKTVEPMAGAWLANYGRAPLTVLAPLVGLGGAGLMVLFSRAGRAGAAFVASGAAIVGVIFTAGISLFPFIMPSSIDPGSSLTIWDATSSHFTLTVMFWATLIFLPIVLAYTFWAFRVMRGKVTVEQVQTDTHNLY